MKSFVEFVNESIVDIPRGNLDPTVFQFPDGEGSPYLNPSIKKQIQNDINDFGNIIAIVDYYLVGSILTKNYNENSDLDVNIIVHKEDIDDLMQAKLLTIIKGMNGKLAIGTTHPINYYILLSDMNEDNYDGIYDLGTDKWVKVPVNVDFNVTEYLNNFHKVVSKIDLTLAQLRRDIVDYDTLSKFSEDDVKNLQIMLKRKLYEITEKIEILIDIKNTIHRQRKKAFTRPLTPEEIQRYKSKNLLPENIIEKLLQKYYYWDFITKLEKMLQSKNVGEDSTITHDDLDDIKKVQQNSCLKSFESFVQEDSKDIRILNEKVRNIKLRKINWKDPKSRSHSFMHHMNRGINRKSLMQVPKSQQVDSISSAMSNIGSAKKLVDIAKNAPSGIWRITPSQVKWLSAKYHHIPPNVNKPMKHLGNTGIVVWRKAPNIYYLVKHSKLHGS